MTLRKQTTTTANIFRNYGAKEKYKETDVSKTIIEEQHIHNDECRIRRE